MNRLPAELALSTEDLLPFLGTGQFCLVLGLSSPHRTQGEIRMAIVERKTLFLEFTWAKEYDGLSDEGLAERPGKTFELALCGWIIIEKNDICILLSNPLVRGTIKVIHADNIDAMRLPEEVS